MPRVDYFGIDGENPESVIPFYEKVFGWVFSKTEGAEYWSIMTGKDNDYGIDGGLSKRTGRKQRLMIYITNVDKYCKLIEENGGKITTPKFTVPGMGDMAFFEDKEGNEFGLVDVPFLTDAQKALNEQRAVDDK